MLGIEEKIYLANSPMDLEFEKMKKIDYLKDITKLIEKNLKKIYSLGKNELLAYFKESTEFDAEQKARHIIKDHNFFKDFDSKFLIDEKLRTYFGGDDKKFKSMVQNWEKNFNKTMEEAAIALNSFFQFFPKCLNDFEKRTKIAYFLTNIPLIDWSEIAAEFNIYLQRQQMLQK